MSEIEFTFKAEKENKQYITVPFRFVLLIQANRTQTIQTPRKRIHF